MDTLKPIIDTLAYNDSVQHFVDSLKALNIQTAVKTAQTVVPDIIAQNYPLAISGGVIGITALLIGFFKIRKAKKGKI